MLESKKNNEAEFMIWLSKKVSSNKLSELYMTFQLIEQQARIEQIVEKSLFENMDVGVLEVVISNILQSKFFLSKRKWQRANINFALNFLIQYASATKIQKNGLKLAINSISDRKHIRSDKESFYQWMLNDESMAEASCQDYLSVVNDAERYAVAHSLSDTKFFGVSREKAKATADALFMNADFVEINKKQHDCYGIAITKLLAFLGVDWTVPEGTQGKRGKRYQLEKQNHDIDSISYETVVAQRYQKGYRLNSSIEMKKFRKYYMEINGVELTQQSKFVEDMIRRCGIEHEGRVYAPSTMLSDELRDDLFCYIEETFDSGKNVIYFEALFRKFSDNFLDSNIYDADMLKAYVSYMAGDRFYIARDYMSAEQFVPADPLEDVRACLKEHGTPMSVDDLCNALSYIHPELIKRLLSNNGEFIRNNKGWYFHVNSFCVADEELENIADLIETEITELNFISGNELYNAIKRKYPCIYEKNAIFSVIGWRDALKYRLGDRFSFVGNIISGKDCKLSMSDVFEDYGKTHDSFNFQELVTFAKSLDSIIYYDALYHSAARISMDSFVSRDRTSFQIKETDRILESFCISDYLALPKIDNFGIFPDASHPWNSFLLEHYVAFHSKKFYLMHNGFNGKVVVGAMVKKGKQYESFDDLVTDILAKSGVSLKKDDALNYLYSNGYIARRSYTGDGIESILINAMAMRNKKES